MMHWLSMGAQVLVLAAFIYYILLFFRGTRGAQVLAGLALSFVGLIALTQIFDLDVLNWLLRQVSVLLGVALLVIFQPEIRRALAELGASPGFNPTGEERETVEKLVQSVALLAEQKVGALIAVEREVVTRAIQDTGVRLDARVAPELLASVFFPRSPLHDGGVIVRGNRVVAAGCIFPLSQNADLHRGLGMRHRAALGLSEETDAAVIVVSEETGAISLCHRGRLVHGVDERRIQRLLEGLLLKRRSLGPRWRSLINWRTTRPGMAGGTEPEEALR